MMLLAAGFCTTLDGQNDMAGKAKVQKYLGYDIYIFSDPLCEYEVVDRLNNGWGSVARAFGGNFSLKDIVASFVAIMDKKDKKAKKKDGERPEVHAIIIEDQERAIAIRYVMDEESP